MKKFITPSYTFTPGTSGVGSVNLSGISSFDVKLLVSIINQTTGELIYVTGSTAYKYTGVSTTTVTMFRDTSTMSGSDVLQVIYEEPETSNYLLGTLKSAQITVGTSEVRATTDGLVPSSIRSKLMIKPNKNNIGSIFLIPTGGTVSTGMEIIGPDRLEFPYDPTDYYLISDTAAQVVEILEVE